MSGTDGDDAILTIPNVISLIRLLCLPLFLYLLFGLDDRFGAALLLGALGATDWVDGYIARHYDQVSALGKVLDPVAVPVADGDEGFAQLRSPVGATPNPRCRALWITLGWVSPKPRKKRVGQMSRIGAG